MPPIIARANTVCSSICAAGVLVLVPESVTPNRSAGGVIRTLIIVTRALEAVWTANLKVAYHELCRK